VPEVPTQVIRQCFEEDSGDARREVGDEPDLFGVRHALHLLWRVHAEQAEAAA
jgi:hypothetical protein